MDDRSQFPPSQQPSNDPYAGDPYATPGAAPASGGEHHGQTYAAGQPGAPAPWPPQAPQAPQAPQQQPAGSGGGSGRRPGIGMAAIALAAALVGGGVGGAVATMADDDGGAASSDLASSPDGSSLAQPVSDRAESAPAGTIAAVAEKVKASVVSIEVRSGGQAPGGQPPGGLPGLPGGLPGQGQGGQQNPLGAGSGVVISEDGEILTNAHVASEGDLTVTFADGRTVTAKLVKADPLTDLAVIKADGIDDATPIAFGSSEALQVGQEVIAIGSPLGLSGTVTRGIVSAKHRPVVPQSGNADGGPVEGVIDAIQTDAPINPGNSGGALVNLQGELVGITSAIASLSSGILGGGQAGSIGLGFAIPIDQARVIAEQLAAGETVAHAVLGVAVGPSTKPTQRGAVVQEVKEGSSAAEAGLEKGDTITRLNDRIIDTSDALVAGVRALEPGKKVELTYIRGNETRTANVSLGSDAESGA